MPAVDVSQTDQLLGKSLLRKLIWPLLLAVFGYSALLFYGDAAAISAALRGLHPLALLAGIALSLGNFALRGLRWQYYLRVRKIHIGWLESGLIFLCGLGMSITPGKVGELLKSGLLKDRYDVPVADSLPVVIAERIMDLGALLTLGGVGLVWSRGPVLGLAVGVALCGAFFLLGKSGGIALYGIHLVSRLPRIARFRDKLLAAHASLFDLWGVQAYLVGMQLSLLAWGFQALIVVVFAADLRAVVALPHALVAYAAPLLAGSLALIPGGLGLTEASMTGALKALSGLSTTSAATLTIMIRVVTFWLATALGLGTLLWWQRVSPQPQPERLAK
jgi:uncharacterized membrane protein YbhN (UPF0104 family)